MKNQGESIAVVMHGLGGHCDAHYALGTAHALYQKGLSVLRLNLRGAEMEPPFVPSLYHAGLTEDVDHVVKHLKAQGFKKISLVGFSLSANLILKYLSLKEQGISKAFVVSPPVNLSLGAQRIDLPKNKIYQTYFLRKLKNILEHKAKLWPDLFSKYTNEKNFKSLTGFDEAITSDFFKFKNAQVYYESASSHRHLEKIKNEVVIVHAKDDPFLDFVDLERLSQSAPKNIQVKLFSCGGHMGFYEGRGGYKFRDWAAQVLG